MTVLRVIWRVCIILAAIWCAHRIIHALGVVYGGFEYFILSLLVVLWCLSASLDVVKGQF